MVRTVDQQQHPEKSGRDVLVRGLLPTQHVEFGDVRAVNAELYQLRQGAVLLAKQRKCTVEQSDTLLWVGLPPIVVCKRHQAHGSCLGVARLLLVLNQTFPNSTLLFYIL